ncbi:competence type IV pilus ATPase ComGA [Bacillus testis]|uniref:competence type IV pilus ATPase ComGA n=1 Tax=Bacillus testis TaxID=1622072 RepID=UPI00067EBA43|nr:competence type IV pilus ATPase ComGA [Bacillus testis]
MYNTEQIAEELLKRAVELGASDIHIFPKNGKSLVQLRVDNKLFPIKWLTREQAERVISHFKFLSGMDIGEKRRPQNGSMNFMVREQIVGLRLSSLPAAETETLVIRLIPRKSIVPIERLALFPETARKILALMKHSHGLFIFSGPTGSGKTTTLYSLLHYAKTFIHRNIITLEDPIENVSEDVLQVQINEKAGISYSVGLKAALRHDPDIIMVGEIRDAETAKIAVRAALTGHLILSTMHTRNAAGAISRLLEFGVAHSEIQQTLIAVSAQRLLELKCPVCEGECSPYCHYGKRNKRASVYELLHGKELSRLLDEGVKGEEHEYTYRLLEDEINKAVALGFAREEEYDRWVYK